MYINRLKIFFSLSLLHILSSCKANIPVLPEIKAAPETEIVTPIEINHDFATSMVDQEPWDFFIRFDDDYQCLLATEKPEHNTPNWIKPNTVWQHISLTLELARPDTEPRFESQFNWYKNHPDYMLRVSKRAERYLFYVTEQIAQRGLPMELALLPIVESAYDPFAYSHGRASGMWQFIPRTARHYKLRQDWWYDGRRDIKDSTNAALTYLTQLNKHYDGDWLLTLAAYNSGQGTVNRAIRNNKKKGKPTHFWALKLPKETRHYVPKLLALAKLIENPHRYNIKLHPIANTPYFIEVDTQSQIDLAQAAQMADISIDEMYRLNPGFNRWATTPSGPHRLLIPASQQALFEQSIKQHPPSKRLHWTRYKIRKGDSLLSLAKRFNTTAEFIRNSNNIRGNMIRAGQSLVIAKATKGQSHYALSATQRLQHIQKKRTGGRATTQRFHIVNRGDSLWSISKRYKVTVASLAKWNGVAPKDTLRLGQKLSVWTQQPPHKQAGTRSAMVRKVGYTVRSGDSLAAIAQRFNLRVGDILKWNTLNRKKYLQPGQFLTLYVDITNAIN